jgi:hypothetical protein
MRSQYLCSSADRCEAAQAALRAHGYVEAIWGTVSHRRLLVVPHPDAYVERVDHLVYRTDPEAQRLGPCIQWQTVARVRRVTTVPALDRARPTHPQRAEIGPGA